MDEEGTLLIWPLEALHCRLEYTSPGLRPPFASSITAATPAVRGAACDVPLSVLVALLLPIHALLISSPAICAVK